MNAEANLLKSSRWLAEWYPKTPENGHERTGTLPRSPGALLGLEFEYEGTGYHPVRLEDMHRTLYKSWIFGADGSLRGDDSCEVKSRGPMHVSHVEYALPLLMEVAKDWQVNRRTGFHVHLDVGHMTYDNLVNLLSLYALLEPAVFTAAGDERSANPFCVPWFKDTHASRHAAHLCRGIDEVGPICHGAGKYSALNFRPITEYGTVEFRHMRNTHSSPHIYGWISMILHFRNAATHEHFRPVFEEVLTTRNYRRFLAWIYGNELSIWPALLYPELEEELDMLSWELARELYYAHLPNTFLRLVNKKKRTATKKEPKPYFRPTFDPLQWEGTRVVETRAAAATPQVRFLTPEEMQEAINRIPRPQMMTDDGIQIEDL